MASKRKGEKSGKKPSKKKEAPSKKEDASDWIDLARVLASGRRLQGQRRVGIPLSELHAMAKTVAEKLGQVGDPILQAKYAKLEAMNKTELVQRAGQLYRKAQR